MAVGEFHREYVEFFNRQIELGLNQEQVWSVIQRTAICRSLNTISPEEAQTICGRIFGLYPQYKESLEKELEKNHLG